MCPQVHDQEVIYKNVSIEGPNGIIRSGSGANSKASNKVSNKWDNDITDLEGYTYKGCFRDAWEDRVFRLKSNSHNMTNKVNGLQGTICST